MLKPMVTVFSLTCLTHPHRTSVLNSPHSGEPEDWQVYEAGITPSQLHNVPLKSVETNTFQGLV